MKLNRLIGPGVAALALVLSAPAYAEGMKVTVGGFTNFQAAYFDTGAANDSHRDFQSESEVHIKADGKTEMGLDYGVKVELQTSTSDNLNADESGMYLAGEYGRLELGDDDGANRLVVWAPTVGIGQINGSYDDFVPVDDRGHAVNATGSWNFEPYNSEDSTKATYISPRMYGLQLGVSYAPELNEGEDVVLTKHTSTFSNIMEFGANYQRDVSGVAVEMGANYVRGTARSGFEDLNAWGAGLKLGYAGFKVGGGYTHDGTSGNTSGLPDDSVKGWNAGMTYETGPWGLGASYVAFDYGTNGDHTGLLGTDHTGGDYAAYVFGVSYTVAPGLRLGADAAFYDRNRSGVAADTDGTIVMTDLTATF